MTLVFSHAACSYYKWVWLQVNFKGAIFADRKKSAKTSKFKCLANRALYGGYFTNAPCLSVCLSNFKLIICLFKMLKLSHSSGKEVAASGQTHLTAQELK